MLSNVQQPSRGTITMFTTASPFNTSGSFTMLDRAIFASIAAMSVFALFSPLY